MPSKPSEPGKSISLSKCPVLPTNAVFLNTFVWTKVLMLKLPVERNKEGPRHDRLNGYHLENHKSTPAGRKQRTSTRTTLYLHTDACLPTIITSAARVMLSLSEVSHSVTNTRAPESRRAKAQTLPTSPYLNTNAKSNSKPLLRTDCWSETQHRTQHRMKE